MSLRDAKIKKLDDRRSRKITGIYLFDTPNNPTAWNNYILDVRGRWQLRDKTIYGKNTSIIDRILIRQRNVIEFVQIDLATHWNCTVRAHNSKWNGMSFKRTSLFKTRDDLVAFLLAWS